MISLRSNESTPYRSTHIRKSISPIALFRGGRWLGHIPSFCHDRFFRQPVEFTCPRLTVGCPYRCLVHVTRMNGNTCTEKWHPRGERDWLTFMNTKGERVESVDTRFQTVRERGSRRINKWRRSSVERIRKSLDEFFPRMIDDREDCDFRRENKEIT